MIEIVNIPEERKAVLIGKKGLVKKELEQKTNTRINIREQVEIEGDVLNIIKVKEIIKAIGRGFTPEKAFKLLNENCQLDIISLNGESKKTIKRLFGRVIGKKGVVRERIEKETGTNISVYGKTISIIGSGEEIESAKEVIEDLLAGKTHTYVYKRLSRLRK